MSIKNKIRKVLFGGLILFMLGGGLGAEEIKSKPVIEQTLEQKASNPKVKITFNSKIETEAKTADYSKLNTTNLTCPIDISNISSYKDLIEQSPFLSENEKLILASKMSSLSVYDSDLMRAEIMSQDDFVYNLQNSLPVGVCRHIAANTARTLNDMEIKAAAVSGIAGSGGGHMYTILKTEDGNAVVDYGSLLITNTKNIEKTLQIYQKNAGSTAFQHLFFEGPEFKYKLITKDGRDFLDFIDYDESSEPLKNALIDDINPRANLEIDFNLESHLTSLGVNLEGLFIKGGEIRGKNFSPMDKMGLFQMGFKREFSVPGIIKVNPDISFVYGSIAQKKKVENNEIIGLKGGLVVATNNEERLNLSSRIVGGIFTSSIPQNIPNPYHALFYDFSMGAGISYKIPINNISIEPYATSQFTIYPIDLGTYQYGLKPSELGVGTVFDIKTSKNTNFSIEPYYLKRIWEQEFGGKAKFEIDNFGINAEGYATKSDYEFCPNKYGFNIGPELNSKNLRLGVNYGIEGTNYDGEVENQSSFKIQADVKF